MTKHSHFILNKPYGYLSQFKLLNKKKKKLLGELFDFPDGTMAIGRLDEASEGLLFLSTSGQMSEKIRSKKVDKEYYVQLDGLINKEAIHQLENGVEIGFEGKKYVTNPCQAKLLEIIPPFPERSKKIRDERHGPSSWVSITITEGKFRQIRKMTAAVGFPTLRLVRVRIGDIKLGNLKTGEVIEVNNFGIE